MNTPTPMTETDEDRESLARGEIPAHIAMPSNVAATPLTDELLAKARTKKLLSSDPRLPWYRLAVKLERDLAAAQEARERAEERVRELENFADLMADEFQRIVVCCKSGDTFVASEIIGLCQRAVKTTKQNVPVIVQRDRAEALAESYKAANAILAHALKHFADESKWGPVADYSAGYWYMTGKPWIPAAKAVEQSDAAIAGEPK